MQRLLVIMFLLTATSSFAQSDSSATIPALFKIDSSAPNLSQRLSTQTVQAWLEQARLSHNTSKGKVYKMPFDYMPCLVPDEKKTASMPLIKTLPDTSMPNAFRMKKTAWK